MEPSDEQLNEAAAKVMGIPCNGKRCDHCAVYLEQLDHKKVCVHSNCKWSPATDIADAMMVVEALREKGFVFVMKDNPFIPDNPWICKVTSKDFTEAGEARSDKLSRAITLAAIRAAGIEVAALDPAPVAGGEKE